MADKYKLLFLLETGERWTVATTTVTLQMHTGSGWVSRDDGGDDDGLGHNSVAQPGQPGGGGG